MGAGAGSGGGGDGVTAVATLVPQCKQNLACGGSSVWQLAQRCANAVPQLIQNFASSGFSAWQVEQIMSILPYTKNVPIVKEKMLLSQSKLSVRRFVA
jgi:hypothetical protein